MDSLKCFILMNQDLLTLQSLWTNKMFIKITILFTILFYFKNNIVLVLF